MMMATGALCKYDGVWRWCYTMEAIGRVLAAGCWLYYYITARNSCAGVWREKKSWSWSKKRRGSHKRGVFYTNKMNIT